jgi:PAS domain S-box-containing protein
VRLQAKDILTIKLGKIMGKDNINDMMALDIYLSGLSREKYTAVNEQVHRHPGNNFPLQSWDVSGLAYDKRIVTAAIQKDTLKLQQLTKRYKWAQSPDVLLEQSYEALIVTDAALTILWVNPGFTAMTGYSAKYAAGKKPNFLQGANTSVTTRAQIREQLQRGTPFKAVVHNYRKNREEYLCEVQIYPLRGKDNTTTHFIALEKEIA